MVRFLNFRFDFMSHPNLSNNDLIATLKKNLTVYIQVTINIDKVKRGKINLMSGIQPKSWWYPDP